MVAAAVWKRVRFRVPCFFASPNRSFGIEKKNRWKEKNSITPNRTAAAVILLPRSRWWYLLPTCYTCADHLARTTIRVHYFRQLFLSNTVLLTRAVNCSRSSAIETRCFCSTARSLLWVQRQPTARGILPTRGRIDIAHRPCHLLFSECSPHALFKKKNVIKQQGTQCVPLVLTHYYSFVNIIFCHVPSLWNSFSSDFSLPLYVSKLYVFRDFIHCSYIFYQLISLVQTLDVSPCSIHCQFYYHFTK